jgi:hypothetical protein
MYWTALFLPGNDRNWSTGKKMIYFGRLKVGKSSAPAVFFAVKMIYSQLNPILVYI